MIDDVRANMGSRKKSSDGEDSIIESYTKNDIRGAAVVNESACDSDNSFESHSRTLRAEDFARSTFSLEQQPGGTREGGIGYWCGVE